MKEVSVREANLFFVVLFCVLVVESSGASTLISGLATYRTILAIFKIVQRNKEKQEALLVVLSTS